MKPIKLKNSKEIEITSILSDYVSKNYGQDNLNQNLQQYFSDFNRNRNVISNNKNEQNTIQDLITILQITTKYFNQLVAIKSKNIFGPQPNSCQISFTWTDTITGNLWGSYNINFEYYNILFNIASLYFYLGYQKSISPKVDKILRKEAIKDYKHSLYLFNIIKQEAINKIEQRELPYDLYPGYCDYWATLCIVYGQIEIEKIAEETSPKEFALRGKLLMGISENFNKAYFLSNGEQAKMGENDSFRNYLINRHFYYKSLVYKKLHELSMKKFDEKGLGYGEALVYQQLAVNQLDECKKTINNCEGLVEIDKFNDFYNKEKNLEAKIKDLNYRIYHQYTPEPNTIKLETKILMVPLPIDNLYIKENESKFRDDNKIYCEDLDLLIPSEIKPMLENFKSQMNNFMQQYLNKYENEDSIKKFLDKFYLPQKLLIKPINADNPYSSEIPPELLEKINEIQQLGGTSYLNNLMSTILSKSNDLIDSLNKILSDIKKEEKEDNYYRKNIGDQWVINPSNTLNMNYIQTIEDNIAKINQARECDIKENKQLIENIDNFSEFNLPKNQIEQKLIQLSNSNGEMTSEEKKLRDEILKLYSLGNKSSKIINPILKDIKCGGLANPLFSEVAMNRMTEKSVFEITKEKYLKQLEPLEGISNEIKNQMNIINDLIPKSENSLFPKSEDNGVFQYLEKLEQNANNFLEEVQKLKSGENYYNELEANINNMIKTINDWLDHRKEEKKMILETFKGRIKKFDPSQVDNPFDNLNNNNSDYCNSNKKNDYFNQNSNYNQNQNYNQNNQNQNINYEQNQNFNQNYQNNQNYNRNDSNFVPNQNYSQEQNYPNFNQNNNQSQNYNRNDSNFNQNQNYSQKQNYNANFNQNYNRNDSNFSQNQNNVQTQNYPNFNQNDNQSQNYNRNDSNFNQNQNYSQEQNYNADFNQNNSQNQNYNRNDSNFRQNQNYTQNQNYSQNFNNNPNQNYYQNSNQYQNNQNYGQSSNQNYSRNDSQNQIYSQNQNNFQNKGYMNNNEQNYNQNKNVNMQEDNSGGYSCNSMNINNNDNPPSQGTNLYNCFNGHFDVKDDNNNNKNNQIPLGFNQSNSFDDHFNPNSPPNMNNFNSNKVNSFEQSNNNNPSYNDNTPYNF